DLYDRPGSENDATSQCLTLVRRRLASLEKDVAKRSSEQVQVLEDRLNSADAMKTDDPARARKIYRAVIELYADKPWAADVVRRAKKSLDGK
ncbi:MAG: hypothetical protein LLG00_09775, partial [Planctomycetaceae bacterium]|nr:hypothetical protein [Planctomycetaceae bacterium]